MDEQNFILKREALKVRFTLKDQQINQTKYQLRIDNVLITNEEIRKQFNKQLIDEKTNHNNNVNGYINIANLKYFLTSNFKIEGSTSQPKLIINDKTKLDALLAIYASDNLFDIQITATKNANDWD